MLPSSASRTEQRQKNPCETMRCGELLQPTRSILHLSERVSAQLGPRTVQGEPNLDEQEEILMEFTG